MKVTQQEKTEPQRTEVLISEINIGNRIRKDFGDIESLANSIMEIGLLHPVVVRLENNELNLMSGRRRLAAYQHLGFAKIPIYITTTATEAIEIEIHENLERKDFSVTEMVEVDSWLRPRLEEEAKERMKAGAKKGGESKGKKGKAATRKAEQRTRDAIAKVVGKSGRTIDKAKRLVEAAKANPEIFRPLLSKVEMGQLSIDRALDQVKHIEKVQESERIIAKLPAELDDKIIHGDFTKVCKTLKMNSIKLIFTDPPYGRDGLPVIKELANISFTLLKNGGYLAFYSGQEFLPEVFEIFRDFLKDGSLKWVWPGAVFHESEQPGYNLFGKKITVTNRWKPILIFVKGEPEGDNIGFVDFLTGEKGRKEDHEWAQGESEARYFIEKLTKPGEYVLDPMLGCGTTLRAAKDLKRRGIGIEINEDSYKIAVAKVSAK